MDASKPPVYTPEIRGADSFEEWSIAFDVWAAEVRNFNVAMYTLRRDYAEVTQEMSAENSEDLRPVLRARQEKILNQIQTLHKAFERKSNITDEDN
jgi:hypothetical protein